MWQIIPLILTVVAANATMDEIKFHWSRWFGKVVKRNFWKNWMDPSLSWKNKYKFKNKYLQYIFSTALVWTTDFWHLLKGVFLNSMFLSIIILLKETVNSDLQIVWMLIMANIAWGVLYEFTRGVYGLLSDIKEFKDA